MKKVLMVATTAAMIEQFNKSNILILKKMNYEVHIVGNFQKGNPISNSRIEQFKSWLDKNNVMWKHIPVTRNPYDIFSNYRAYKILVNLISKNRYEFVHCHTPIGSVIGRLAAHKTKTPVIYTAHGFHFFKGAPLKNWVLYYPVEKFLSKWTKIIITINHYDYYLAKNKFHAKSILLIPGVGIDIDKITERKADSNILRKKFGFRDDDFVVMSVGELNSGKNHSVIIRAISELNNKKIKYIICGQGSYREKLLSLIHKLGMQNQVELLGFRSDVYDILKAADCFAFPSKREGLGLAALEAMAVGLPLVTSDCGGILEYSKDGVTGFIHRPDDVHGFAQSINKLYRSPKMREKMGKHNQFAVKEYSIESVDKIMWEVYQNI